MDYDLFKKCCTNGLALRLDIAEVEDKYFMEVGKHWMIGYLDVVTKDGTIIDWKSGTYTKAKAKEYSQQLKCYSYLYWRRHNKFPKAAKLYFPKNDKWFETDFTEADIVGIEDWIISRGDEITKMKMDETSIWKKNTTKCFFCGYKGKCLYNFAATVKSNFTINISGTTCTIDGDVSPLIDQVIEKELSYDMKDKYFIQEAAQKRLGKRPANYDRIGTKFLYNKSRHAFRIGHIDKVKKILNDYAEFTKKPVDIKIVDNRANGNIHFGNLHKSNVTLRDYQQEAVASLLHKQQGFLEVATGGGKTLITAEIIRRLGLKTLWICDRKELVTQTKQVFEDELGIKCGMITAGYINLENSYVVLATIQTLAKKIEAAKKYLDEVDLVIVDEAHHSSADTYVKVLTKIGAKYRLGTTGTVKRDDGNEMIMESLIGEVIYKIDAKELIKRGHLVKPEITFFKTQFEGDPLDNRPYAEVYTDAIVNNIERNAKIKELADGTKKTLILVNRIDHGVKLFKLLGENVRFLHGSLSKECRELYFKWFKETPNGILIGTASILSEGIDIPDLEVLINAAGNKGEVKTIQGLGRALRTSIGKKQAWYYDFMDECAYFKDAAKSRVKTLEDQGYEVFIK
jgi:superfamily II DNA or RNA helicase/CRISPR/Cas system-associated exonuclease Cas4 (RecB family)